MTLARRAAAVAAVCTLLSPLSLFAQGWGADVYAGGTRYDALSGRVSATNLIANLRFQSRIVQGYASAAAPLDEIASLWGAGGLGLSLGRFLTPSVTLGAQLAGDGYAFDDRQGSSGSGAVLHALPLLRFTRGTGLLELHAGGHEHVFSFPDTSGSRAMLEVAGRAGVGTDRLSALANVRLLSADEGSYPYASGQLSAAASVARLSVWVGKWFADTLDNVEWGAGVSVPVASLGELWFTVRQDGADPLYLGSERRSWNVGFSRQLSAPPGPPPSLVPRIERGAVRIRLPQDLVQDAAGTPSVAGEFSSWQPVAMTRAGSEWVLDLPLETGVYRFSFVSSAGAWFVPDRYPGRIDDGFGGWVALLVVP